MDDEISYLGILCITICANCGCDWGSHDEYDCPLGGGQFKPEDSEQMGADAKLGRLVRAAVATGAGPFLQRISLGTLVNDQPGYWAGLVGSSGEQNIGRGDTLEAALIAAGIKDE